MSVRVILGAQWGDEGKGKIVDYLADKADYVARYQGGANAGHTVIVDRDEYVLHLVPSGILNPHTVCLLGNGLVIDPQALMDEIALLEAKGISVKGRLFISPKAHLIMPYHKLLDGISERVQGGAAIGTTGRGIGPAYVDKVNRRGIRIVDLLDRDRLKDLIHKNVHEKNEIISKIHGENPLDVEEIVEEYLQFDAQVDPYVKDVSRMLNQAILENKEVLIEGAQGTLLDIDHGTYPFVTSSNPVAGGASTGLGIGPNRIDRVSAVIKAYTTRVGNGPFPTELHDDEGELLRSAGGEFGATTGRSRRCGWFDAVLARYAVQINGIDELIVTKLDVLDTFSEIKICTHYRVDGEDIYHFPADTYRLNRLEPVYETMPGWQLDTKGLRNWQDLPEAAQKYLQRLAELAGVPLAMVSVGPGRDENIHLQIKP
jgi:adenylosuccinate synthase